MIKMVQSMALLLFADSLCLIQDNYGARAGSGYVMAATCRCDGAAHESVRAAIPFLVDGFALPSASIVQYAFPGTARERGSYSVDSRQRGFLPPVRRNRCVPLRQPHSARRSTYQSALVSSLALKVVLETAARKAGQPNRRPALSRLQQFRACRLQVLQCCPGWCTGVPDRSWRPAG